MLCLDDPHVQTIIPRVTKRYLTYGMHSQADVTGRILETRDSGSRFEVTHRNAVLGEATVRMPGEHNVLNSLAAITVGIELLIPFS